MQRKCYSYLLVATVAAFVVASAGAAVVYKDVSDLTREATEIVVGDVTDVYSFWNNDRTLIQTEVTVKVDQYLTGTGTGYETFVLDGGTVDDTTLTVSVHPTFETGDRVLLFLGDSSIRLVQVYQGAYLTDGRDIVRMHPSCENARVIDSSRWSLSEFVAEIERALPAGQVLPELKPYRGDFQIPDGGLRYGLCGSDWTYKTNPMGEHYYVNPNCVDSSAGSAAEQLQQIQNGFASWNGAGADFQFTYGGATGLTNVNNDGTNIMYFATNPPGSGDYVAVNYHWSWIGRMTESDIAFNDRDVTWWNGSGSCSGKMDIWNVATHELGHTLCLIDLYDGSDAAKTMYGYVSNCDTHARTLHADDINGMIAIYGQGTDSQPPTPNPLTWSSVPSASAPTVINMTATSASDISSPVEYYFWASNGNHRDWDTSRSYQDSNAAANTQQSYRVQARDNASPRNTGDWSTTESVITQIETPLGVTFGTVTTNSIEMHVQGPLTNLNVGTSGAYFATTTAGGGYGVQQWIQVTTDTATNLTPNKEYEYRVRARNQNNIATSYSLTSAKYTLANAPGTPAITNVTDDSLDLTINVNGNPTYTPFAVRCTSSDDASWSGRYVSAAGTPTASPVWRTAGEWGTIGLTGLQSGANYCFSVKARNGENVETTWSTISCEQTSFSPTVCAGDCNCDDLINWRDIDFFVAAMNDNVAAWEGMFAPAAPTCSFDNCDANGDGTVNWRDIDPLVAVMNTACP